MWSESSIYNVAANLVLLIFKLWLTLIYSRIIYNNLKSTKAERILRYYFINVGQKYNPVSIVKITVNIKQCQAAVFYFYKKI